MPIETWETRVVSMLQTVPAMDAADLADRTGLKLNRAASVLSRLATYGRIKKIRDHNPYHKVRALYAKRDAA